MKMPLRIAALDRKLLRDLWEMKGQALAIAAVKGSLVAGFFMHLISEKQIVFSILIFTFIFFLALLILPAFSV